MLSLAFECAGQGLSAALAQDGELIDTTALAMDRGQPAALLPALHDLLDRRGLTGADVQRVGCTLGPGGFTGIRLGLSAALGFARSSGAAFYGFNAFDVFALAESECRGLCIALESRRTEIFARIYDDSGNKLALNDAVMAPQQVQAQFRFSRVIGSAASKIRAEAVDAEPDMAVLARFMSATTQGSPLLDQARDKTAPLYLRAPEIGGPARS